MTRNEVVQQLGPIAQAIGERVTRDFAPRTRATGSWELAEARWAAGRLGYATWLATPVGAEVARLLEVGTDTPFTRGVIYPLKSAAEEAVRAIMDDPGTGLWRDGHIAGCLAAISLGHVPPDAERDEDGILAPDWPLSWARAVVAAQDDWDRTRPQVWAQMVAIQAEAARISALVARDDD